jgi:hypothetical protein
MLGCSPPGFFKTLKLNLAYACNRRECSSMVAHAPVCILEVLFGMLAGEVGVHGGGRVWHRACVA